MKIKSFIIAVLFSLLFINVRAQEDQEEIKTIFDQGVHRISGFGGPFMYFSTFHKDFAHFMGGGGGVLINNKFYLGGFGFGLTTSHPVPTSQYDRLNLDLNTDYKYDFGYGGLMFGYIFGWSNAIHLTVGFQGGWGAISIRNPNDFTDWDFEADPVYVLSPLAEVEMNITRFFRIGVGANYRYVGDVDFSNLDDMDLSSPGVYLSFKFGWF